MESSKDEKVYMGILGGNWKQRFYKHRHSFANPLLRNHTALSKWFWSLKESGLTSEIKSLFIKESFQP